MSSPTEPTNLDDTPYDTAAESPQQDSTGQDDSPPDAVASDTSGAERAERMTLPPPTFHTLITMLSTQALVGLGLIPHPASGKPTPNAELAKHFIDLLGVVEQKCRGNLEQVEQRGLDAALHDLRMAYVQFISRSA